MEKSRRSLEIKCLMWFTGPTRIEKLRTRHGQSNRTTPLLEVQFAHPTMTSKLPTLSKRDAEQK